MTGSELRSVVVAQAMAWLGKKESDNSFRSIIDAYNSIQPLPSGYRMSYTDPWCAAFVSAVGWVCGLSGILYPECSCDRMIALYKKHGRWVEDDAYVPSPGDIIFYDWDDTGEGDNTGSSDHVGIVSERNGSVLTVIEGNMSDSVGRRRFSVNGRYVRGYGVPDYAAGGEPSEKQDEKSGEPTPAGLPTLKRGDISEVVRAAQFLLNGRGCSCGIYGADGEFGPATEAAVLAFQRRNGLAATGIVDAQTWAALLGVTK